ncbi:hypothetical protein [Methanosarcina mazei]|uniref:DUF5655 domain-containing protein n=1 Tax=Methanosarcina mazei TaxID=2209 RepID=A0A0F8IY75_METMZ|nr:hypothetical protein [Methanosarcina mazei]KKG94557.1 hypothetical protein DU69_13810 [Methanosarcina mazei]
MTTSEAQKRRKKEKRIQKEIEQEPELLGLGTMTLKAREKRQINGRLDLQLKGYDDSKTRYEVELQLGKLDNDHLLRCVRYWNYERRKCPQFKHYAVIVAEEIPEYMLEEIVLFKVPIIAIKISIDQSSGKIAAAKRLDLPIYEWAIVENQKCEEIEDITPFDMAYLETKLSEESLRVLNEIYRLAREVNPETEMNITKNYVGFTDCNLYSYMFVRNKNDSLILELVLDESPDIKNKIQEAGLIFKNPGNPYTKHKSKHGHYDIQINIEDINKKEKEIKELIEMAYEEISK